MVEARVVERVLLEWIPDVAGVNGQGGQVVSEVVVEVRRRDHHSEQVEVMNTGYDEQDLRMGQLLGWSKAAGVDDHTGHMGWVWL